MQTVAQLPQSSAPPMTEAPPPIEPFAISDAVAALWGEIERLELAYHIAELEVKGYTIVPPGKAAPPDFAAKMLESACALVERRTGMRLTPDMTASVIRPELKQAFGFPMNYVLFEDPIFQEALLNPIGLALTTYLLGQNALLSSASILVKGPGGLDLPLHADSFRMPDPLPHLPQICNITWALTDYSYDNGALAVVPGSHRYLRRPLHNEGIAQRVAVEAPAGSMIVWGGQLWHGAFARKNPGFRATLTFYMCRPHMTTQEAYGECVPKDVIDRNPPRMAVLLGQRMNYGWREAGPTLATGVDEGAPNSFAMGRHAYD